jgi:uncharacterized protein YndB with AHSA1/START domain
VVEAEIAAPAAEVWAAFTTKEGIEGWMAPMAEVDLRVGGTIRSNYNPEGTIGDAATIENTILAYDPERMLAMRATGLPDGFPYEEVARGTWSVIYFTELGPKLTRVTLVGLGYTDSEESRSMREFFTAGNAQLLGGLEQKLTSNQAD